MNVRIIDVGLNTQDGWGCSWERSKHGKKFIHTYIKLSMWPNVQPCTYPLLFQVVTSRSSEEDQPYQKLNPLNPCTVISPKSCPWICACISWVPVNTTLNIKILRGKKGGFVSINAIDYHDIWMQTFIWIWSWLFIVQVWVLLALFANPKTKVSKDDLHQPWWQPKAKDGDKIEWW